MDPWIDPVIGLTSRLVLTLVFGAALMHKILAPHRFIAVLREYRLLPATLVAPASLLVIFAEAFAILGIWWQALRVWAASTAVVLLAIYGIAIGINLWRGRRTIDCGCSFGSANQPLSNALLVRNALLMLPCAAAGLPETSALDVPGLAVGVLGAVALGLCYQVWGVLLSNRPRILQMEEPK